MGYFDGLTNSSFKKDESGKTVFYPWGIWGRGRILPNEEAEIRVRGFVRLYYIVIFILSIVVGNTFGWKYVFVLLPILIVWYYFKSRALIAAYPISGGKLTMKESVANSAKAHNKPTLWALFICSLLFTLIGAWMIIDAVSNYDKIMGVFVCLIFGACVLTFGYMIKHTSSR